MAVGLKLDNSLGRYHRGHEALHAGAATAKPRIQGRPVTMKDTRPVANEIGRELLCCERRSRRYSIFGLKAEEIIGGSANYAGRAAFAALGSEQNLRAQFQLGDGNAVIGSAKASCSQ